MIQSSIYLIILMAALTTSCSTYKQNGKCYDYKPVGCINMSSSRLVCEVNADGCETCNCVSQPTGKDLPLNRLQTK
ncbi:hypothetical protein K2X05_08280 [bacterium]|nr:hypothetical protein [bacterium]